MVIDGDKSVNPADDIMLTEENSLHSQDPHDDGSQVSHIDQFSDNEEQHTDGDVLCHLINPSMSGDDGVSVESIISKEYTEDEIVPQLPPIDDKLSAILTKWMHVVPSRDKVKKLFKEYMLPTNVPGLNPVQINDSLYEKLRFTYRLNDQKLRGINTFFAWVLGPLVLVWDQILKWESALLNREKCKDKHVKVSLSTLQLDDFSIDFTAIRRSMHKGLRLLASGHSIVLEKRSGQLKSFFDLKFHYLLKPSNPVTDKLLGDNVDQKIAESTKLMEAAHRLQLRHPPWNMYTQQQSYTAGRATYRGNQGCHPFFPRHDSRKRQMSGPYNCGQFKCVRFSRGRNNHNHGFSRQHNRYPHRK